MSEEKSRRRFLRRGLAVGFATVSSQSVASAHGKSNTLEIESEGGGVAAYEFTVSGSISQRDSGDHVRGNRAYGHVGPARGSDTFSYSGEITGFSLAGPARAFRNGYRVRPSNYPAPGGVPSATDFPSNSGTTVLRVESEGGGFGVYEFQVSGSVEQRDGGDHVSDSRVYGHVGPERGADEFAVTGDVTWFSLAGPARVTFDGRRVTDGGGGGSRGVVRVSPEKKITAPPDTTLLFEALARGYRGDRVESAWYVDGQRRHGPDAFYGHLNTDERRAFTASFDSTGTHRVRAELYDEGKSTDENAQPIGTVQWVVAVDSGANGPPTAERVKPESDTLKVSRDSSEETRFVADSTAEGYGLDRVVWWLGQCDDVVGVSSVGGTSATASISFAPGPGCPLVARPIDERGAVGESDPWLFEAEN